MNAPLAVAASGEAGDGGTAARVFALQAGLRDVETRLGTMPSTAEVQALVTEVRRLQEELPAVAAEARSAATAARASYAVVAAAESLRELGKVLIEAVLRVGTRRGAWRDLKARGAQQTLDLRHRCDQPPRLVRRQGRQHGLREVVRQGV